MGAIVETPSLHLNMTARENLQIQFDTIGIKDYSSIDSLLEFVGLADTGKKAAKNFSLGMRQRLAIAIAMCNNPEFLVLKKRKYLIKTSVDNFIQSLQRNISPLKVLRRTLSQIGNSPNKGC